MSNNPAIHSRSVSPHVLEKLTLLARDIKLSHTLFAMPWAILATFLAGATLPVGHPYLGQLLLILACMVFARTVAMLSNRLFDAHLDRLNPRTASRALPSGKLSVQFALAVTLISALAFVLSTALFLWFYANPWPVILSLPVLVFIASYPLLKRFTRLCHYYLGAALALAPICAYLAIAGTLNLPPLLMAGAVLTWTAGFDILYACQDYHSDLQTGTFSVPAKLGIGRALFVARATHVLCAAFLIALGLATPSFATLYWIGALLAILLLAVEHSLVSAEDLSKINLSFFTINGIISLLIGTLGVIDIFL